MKASFRDVKGEVIEQNLLMLAHYSPENKQIKVSTSTDEPKVSQIWFLFKIVCFGPFSTSSYELQKNF